MNYYYISAENKAEGPVSAEQLQTLLAAGTVNAGTKVAAVGANEWVPISVAVPVPMNAGMPPPINPVPAPKIQNTANGLAVTSLVFSLLAIPGALFCCCGPVFAIVGIVCGHLGLARAKKNPAGGGRGLALAGTIIGYVSVLFLMLLAGIFVALALNDPRFMDDLKLEMERIRQEQYRELD